MGPLCFDRNVQVEMSDITEYGSEELRLGHELEMLHAEIASLEERSARDIQELRVQVRGRQREHVAQEQMAHEQVVREQASVEQKTHEQVVAEQTTKVCGLLEPGHPSSGSIPDVLSCSRPSDSHLGHSGHAFETRTDSSGLLYVQKIAELEQLDASLESDVKLLQASKQCLLADSREKDELIVYLMRTIKSAELKKNGTKSRSWWSFLGWGERQDLEVEATVDELERIAEEAMRDNARLRKDLHALAKEFQKAVLARNAV